MSAATTTFMVNGIGHIMKHQVRMEMLVETGKKKVTIDAILTELMKLANSEHAIVDFFDAQGDPFNAQDMPTKAEFEERFSVTIVQTAKFQKIMLGLLMASTVSIADQKDHRFGLAPSLKHFPPAPASVLRPWH